MRIVHLAKFYPPEPGGMEYVVRDIAEQQASGGHSVLVLAHSKDLPPGLTELSPTLRVKRSRVLWRAGRGYAPLAPGLFWDFRAALRDFRPHIVHLHSPNLAALPLIVPIAPPLVVHWHSDVVFPESHAPAAWQLQCWRKLEKVILRRAARVICTSPAYAATSRALEPWQDKCRVVPLTLSENAPPASEAPGPASRWLMGKPAGGRILSVGRLSHYKGFSVLLEALARLPQASLCLIGSGEERERLAEQIARLKLSDRVLLAGSVSDADRDAALAACDIFCLPSLDRSEAFGLVLLEAMRAGKACLATSVKGSGMGFAVKEGETGLLARPGDADSLTQALGILLDDRELRERYAAAGRARFLAQFTHARMAAALDDVYAEVT